MSADKEKKGTTLIEWVYLAAYCGVVFHELHGTTSLTAKGLLTLAKVCRWTARHIGQLGIQAELEYRDAIDRERMN